VVALEVAQIAIQLLGEGEPGDRVASLARVERDLPRLLAADRYEALVQAHEACARIDGAEGVADPRVGPLARSIRDFYSAPTTLAATVEAIGRGAIGPDATLYGLARAAGTPLVTALVDAVAERRDGSTRARLGQALLSLDAEMVRSVVTATYRREPAKARALLAAINGLGVSALGDIAVLFIGDQDSAVRHDAFRMLFASGLSPARCETMLRKALEDDAARIVDLALSEVASRPPSAPHRLLGDFLASRSAAQWERQQHRAVSLLLQAATREARAALSEALDRGHRRIGGAARRVCFGIVEGLEGVEDPGAKAACAAYRRSLAGLLGRFLGQGRAQR